MIQIGNVRMSATPMNPHAARNLPTIACHGAIGSVINSSIVPDLRSSAHNRIAIAGTRNR